MAARTLNRLKARHVKTLAEPGRHADGGGLYLSISKNGGRRWVFLYRRQGRLREMGLGSARGVSLAEARQGAADARRTLREGRDPIAHRLKADAAGMTFAEAARFYIESHKPGWKHAKHAVQQQSRIDTYAAPAIGRLPVSDVDTSAVLRAIEPIWLAKPETARRVRSRIEAVLDWATARGYRNDEHGRPLSNPARWRGHLDKLLPAPNKVRKVRHFAALPYAEMGAFMAELREQGGLAALALKFTILTAARTNEAIGAKWSEIDLDAEIWTVPGERTKSGRPHRVPLSESAIGILEGMQGASAEYVFSGGKSGKPLSNMAMLALLERMGRADITVHGFRSSFRDWAGERTNFPREVAEAALSHVVKDATERAYARGDLFEKRRKLMAAWATFCGTLGRAAVVVPLGSQKQMRPL